MTSPDALHPLKAHAVMIEEALGIPHDPEIQRLLRESRIPSIMWPLEDEAPLSINLDAAKAQQFLEELKRGFVQTFSHRRPRKSLDPSRYSDTLDHVYGLTDGHIRPLEDLAQPWDRTPTQVDYYRRDGLMQFHHYLAQRHGITVRLMDTARPVIAAVRASFLS